MIHQLVFAGVLLGCVALGVYYGLKPRWGKSRKENKDSVQDRESFELDKEVEQLVSVRDSTPSLPRISIGSEFSERELSRIVNGTINNRDEKVKRVASKVREITHHFSLDDDARIAAFTPRASDEISIEPGNIISLLHEYKDGYVIGINWDTEESGVFPKMAIEPLSEEEPAQTLKSRPEEIRNSIIYPFYIKQMILEADEIAQNERKQLEKSAPEPPNIGIDTRKLRARASYNEVLRSAHFSSPIFITPYSDSAVPPSPALSLDDCERFQTNLQDNSQINRQVYTDPTLQINSETNLQDNDDSQINLQDNDNLQENLLRLESIKTLSRQLEPELKRYAGDFSEESMRAIRCFGDYDTTDIRERVFSELVSGETSMILSPHEDFELIPIEYMKDEYIDERATNQEYTLPLGA